MADTNLASKLLAITDEIGKIEKTGTNSNQNYKFIEAAEVTFQVKTLLVKHGVLIVPSATKQVVHPKEKGCKVTLEINYTIIDTEKPTDRLEVSWVGEGDDTLDKATQKAGTSAHKYFLMKLFNISDKEDPDAESPDTGKIKKAVPAPTSPATNQQRKRIVDALGDKGIMGEDGARVVLALTEKSSTAMLTQDEAERLLQQLQTMKESEVKNLLELAVPFK